jgi:hypothetical protein
MRTLPPEEKTSYIARNGLNRVRVDRAVRLAEGGSAGSSTERAMCLIQ